MLPEKPEILHQREKGATGEPSLWQQVLQTPGFDEAWERARQQARAGEVVSFSEIRKLQDQDKDS